MHAGHRQPARLGVEGNFALAHIRVRNGNVSVNIAYQLAGVYGEFAQRQSAVCAGQKRRAAAFERGNFRCDIAFYIRGQRTAADVPTERRESAVGAG
ncbi:hypothetical protein SDC9_100320 [bioreactor metagenome]|uniref:Uncharacterized protein n=1 Tax=bioreactor metagenome TaxID=1076179 RepID=A0A645AK06_9ZZZZ